MELQLGLAQPITKGFDLTFHDYDLKNQMGSIKFATPKNTNNNATNIIRSNKKRSFGDAFEQQLNNNGGGGGGGEITQKTTLSLLLWNDQPPPPPPPPDEEEEEDNPNDSSSTINKNNDGDGAIIGWPPLRNLRTKQQQCRYIKVKMEGEGITRKIDLNRFSSYPTLSLTLIEMFGKCKENAKNNYNLTYQDSEGDWLLAGDGPWRSFNESAQRLQLLRKND